MGGATGMVEAAGSLFGPSAVTMNCTGSEPSSATSGAEGEARVIGGGVKRSIGAGVGKGGFGGARVGVDGEREGECPPPPRSSTAPPHIVFSLPFSSVLQAAEMG
jgi:hypothetical protein